MGPPGCVLVTLEGPGPDVWLKSGQDTPGLQASATPNPPGWPLDAQTQGLAAPRRLAGEPTLMGHPSALRAGVGGDLGEGQGQGLRPSYSPPWPWTPRLSSNQHQRCHRTAPHPCRAPHCHQPREVLSSGSGGSDLRRPQQGLGSHCLMSKGCRAGGEGGRWERPAQPGRSTVGAGGGHRGAGRMWAGVGAMAGALHRNAACRCPRLTTWARARVGRAAAAAAVPSSGGQGATVFL